MGNNGSYTGRVKKKSNTRNLKGVTGESIWKK